MEKITSCLYMYEYEKYTAQEQKKKIGPRPAATYSTHLEKENENILTFEKNHNIFFNSKCSFPLSLFVLQKCG